MLAFGDQVPFAGPIGIIMRSNPPGSGRLIDEPVPEGVWPDDRAIHRYEVVVEQAPALESGLRWIGVTVANVLVQDDVVVPGGDRIHVKDRVSGSILTTVKQGFGDSFDMARHLNEQLAELSTVQFAQRWLSTP